MTDLAIIGAGIIGLATARDLLIRHPGISLVVLEKEDAVASHQSGRNSGVLHSGLYYPPGSQKARLCRSGARLMVEFCEAEGITFRQTGKVVVAANREQVPRLDALKERGTANGVAVHRLSQSELAEVEPHVAGVAALHVPEAGVVEYDEVCRRLAADIESRGGIILLGAAVSDLAEAGGRVRLQHDSGHLESRAVVNCGGLYSDRIAAMMGLTTDMQIVPFRGEYFQLASPSADLVRTAVYPVADPRFPFLGVHVTRRANGLVEAGPNAVLALAREGYTKTTINPGEFFGTLSFKGTRSLARQFWRTGLQEFRRSLSRKSFTRSVQELVPGVAAEDLTASGAGVRAQAVSSTGALIDDFVIERTNHSVHVLNAPSPGATASLALAGHIAGLASELL